MSTFSSYTIAQTWVLRPAYEGDFSSLYENCWRDQDDARQTFELALLRQKSRKAVTVVAATVTEDTPIAFGQLSQWRSGAEISDLIVMEMWRRQGIGRHMIEHLLDIARQKSLPYVDIGVENSNAAALTLYKKCGFMEVTAALAQPPTLIGASVSYLRISLRP